MNPLTRTRIFSTCLLVAAALLSACTHPDEDPQPLPKPPGGKLFPQVRSIVHQHCTATCHAPSFNRPNGLPVVLETDTDIVQRATSIQHAVNGPFSPMNKRMPPDTPLSAADVDIINQWVVRGGHTSD